jgi:serine/threonine protein kinase
MIRHLLFAAKSFEDYGVIHRDLKPDNLIIKCPESDKALRLEDCQIMVIDWGFAVDLSRKSFAKEGCGTIGYMAPENFNKEKDSKVLNAEITAKVDVYSLGVIFYEL